MIGFKIISLKRANRMANFICFLLFILCFISCNQAIKKEVHLETSSIKIPKIETKKKGIKVEKDSVFLVKGLPFEVNGIECYWEYKIEKTAHDDDNVSIRSQTLKIIENNKILFETSRFSEEDNLPVSEKSIVDSKAFNLECIDINADGYCDFKILIERAAAGANETYDVFLFNSQHKKFEFSELFSGTNVEYDKEKNRISFMWKNGAGMYSFGYKNLKKNKKDIAFFENINQNQDTIIYTKSIGKKIVKTKRVVFKREEWQGNDVNDGAGAYLLERNKN